MIVRDEITNLARCLESVVDVADELVVVDTGSKDATMRLARRYTEHVYEHPWQDSFAEARNAAQEYCTGDWILHIDADEELAPESAGMLKLAISVCPERADAITVPILSYLSEGRVSVHYFPRIHRRERAHWEKAVHNQLVYPGDYMVAPQIRLLHYGYNLRPEEMAAKWDRTEALLRKELEGDPTHPFTWRNLSRIWRNRGKYDLVMQNAAHVLANDRAELEQRHAVAADLICALTMKGLYPQAEETVNWALSTMPDDCDFLFYKALLYQSWKRWDRTIPAWEEYIALVDGRKTEIDPHWQMSLDHWDSRDAARQFLAIAHKAAEQPAEKETVPACA